MRQTAIAIALGIVASFGLAPAQASEPDVAPVVEIVVETDAPIEGQDSAPVAVETAEIATVEPVVEPVEVEPVVEYGTPVHPIAIRPVTPIVVVELPTYQIPPCETEDSEDCYWDAALMGNGIGESFIRFNGVTYYAG